MSWLACDVESRPRCSACEAYVTAVVRIIHVAGHNGDGYAVLAKLCRACIDRASETLAAAERKELPPAPGGEG